MNPGSVSRFVLACALSAGFLPAGALAASMHVAPLRLDLGPQRPVASMVIGNPEQEEFAVQAEVVAWTQENGRDVYTPTRDALINPSIFRIPAGGQQIVRVGLQVGTDAKERSYRVFVRQLPQERGPGQATGLQTLLRIGIPVFVAPAQPAEAAEWRLVASPTGGWDIALENKGNTHIQITSLVVRRENGEELVRRSLSHYVLPGSTMPIVLDKSTLPALAADTPLRIEAVAAGDRALPPIVLRVPNAPPAAR
ncbi:molecular chaperone [Variovorax sp. VNK109]|uniref:fimbrial biogenesis chaperone n=1 Tax=Variovorax sp. VNK109 TaxID=3400919 RepID=UPI003C08F81B